MAPPAPTDEELIEAVIRVRLSGAAESAAQVHAALEGEGLAVTLPAVKKACSKAAKRTGSTGAPAAPAAPASSEEPPTSKKKEKAAAKQISSAQAMMKAAEQSMMDCQRKLRLAKAGAKHGEVTISGTMEEFMQYCTMKAITGSLAPGDAGHLRERIDADIATLEWIKLATAAGQLTLTEDVIALGGELQLTRLREARDAKDLAGARECFVDEEGREERPEDGASLDKMVARSAAMHGQQAPGALPADAMSEMD